MRRLLFAALVAAAACPPVLAPALAQVAPPSPDAVADRLTWEELPASLRTLLERRMGEAPPQPVLRAEPTPVDATARTVDHGDLVFLQAVTTAAGARLTEAPARKQHGVVGTALWPARGVQGTYYCWIGAPSLGIITVAGPRTYCWSDKDGDGRFESLFEQDGGVIAGRLNYEPVGREVRLKAPVGYEPLSEAKPTGERVGLRYVGLVGGRVGADGRVVDGAAEFELVGGPDPARLTRITSLRASLDAEGRGRLKAVNGVELDVERVDVGGEAHVRLRSGLAAGEVQLAQPPSREDLLEMVRLVLNPDGSPKARPAT